MPLLPGRGVEVVREGQADEAPVEGALAPLQRVVVLNRLLRPCARNRLMHTHNRREVPREWLRGPRQGPEKGGRTTGCEAHCEGGTGACFPS